MVEAETKEDMEDATEVEMVVEMEDTMVEEAVLVAVVVVVVEVIEVAEMAALVEDVEEEDSTNLEIGVAAVAGARTAGAMAAARTWRCSRTPSLCQAWALRSMRNSSNSILVPLAS